MQIIAKISLLGLAIGAGFLAPDIIERVRSHSLHTSSSINLNDYCQLSTKTCSQSDIQMTLEHDTAQPLMPSELTVEWPQNNAESLMLSLQGLEMEMGVVKVKLNRTEGGTYIGDVLLPVCTMEEMTWVGDISDGNQSIKTALRMAR